MDIQFIVNPSAGGTKGREFSRLLEKKIRNIPGNANWTCSRDADEGLQIARQAQEKGCRLVVACGGDGTVHGLLPAFINRPAVLGVIPIGTANDLARNWRIPLDPEAALQTIAGGSPRNVDIIETDAGAHIAGVAGIGFDVAVAAQARQWRPFWHGLPSFVFALVWQFARFPHPRIAVHAGDWHYNGSAWQILLTKIPRYALLCRITHPFPADSGRMEIFLIPRVSRAHLLRHVGFFFQSGLGSIPGVLHRSAEEARVESEPALLVHGDGELIGKTPMSFRVLPRALQVMMPPHARSGSKAPRIS